MEGERGAQNELDGVPGAEGAGDVWLLALPVCEPKALMPLCAVRISIC